MMFFEIGSVRIYLFGLITAAAAALSLALAARQMRNMKSGSASLFAVLAIPLCVLCARVGYCLARLDWVLARGRGFFWQLARGGYMMWGAIAGGWLACLAAAKLSKQRASAFSDAAAAPAALLIAALRIAESLVGRGYGRNIAEWFSEEMEQSVIVWEDPSVLYRWPLALKDYYDEWCFGVFLFEALTALLIFAVLLRLKNTRPGGRAALFLLLYAACQIIWESMLQVGVLRWGFVRVQQVFSAVAVLAALLCAFFRLPQKERRLSELILRITGLIVCCGVIMTMEFALEQKITFLLFMRMDICYLVMALGCAGLILTALPMWRRAYRKA